jgi:VWFA-related protein
MVRTIRLAAGLGVLALGVLGQVAIEPRSKKPPAQEPAYPPITLRADQNLVLVPVTVYDPLNRPVSGLEKENFRVLDNNVEQTISHFYNDDDPVAVGLVFDVSGSMGRGLNRSRYEAREFFRAANPEDEFCLIEFDSNPRLVIPLTRDRGRIESDITFTKSGGSTALVDAAILGMHELKKSKLTRKALLIISDGGENNSRYSIGEMRDMVRESDCLIYAVLVGGDMYESAGPWYLNQMTELSGGRVLPGGISDVVYRVSVELRNRYVVGFTPTDTPRDGRYHAVLVQIKPPRGLPKLHASWRRGYYAPGD